MIMKGTYLHELLSLHSNSTASLSQYHLAALLCGDALEAGCVSDIALFPQCQISRKYFVIELNELTTQNLS